MSFKPSQDNHEIAEINMIPFIDIMLVLLVIFMIASPLLTQKIPVNLPQAAAQNITVDKPIDISVTETGVIYINQQTALLNQVGGMVLELKNQGADQVNIQADRNVRYDILANLMSVIQQQGISKLGFVTQSN